MKNSIALLMLVVLFVLGACGNEKSKKINNPVPVLNESQEANEDASDSVKTDGATPEQLKKAKEIIASLPVDQIEGVNAKKFYKNYCAICHGFKGNMMINGAKDLTKSNISLEESVAQVYFGKGLMTPFKGILKEKEIVAVAHYIETLRAN